MNIEPNKIKNIDDILANHTSVEVESGVYVNSGIISFFKNINKNLEYLGLDSKTAYSSAIYQYNITDKLYAHIYINSKHDHLELVHFYDLPEFFDKNYTKVLNLFNREMNYSKAISNLDNMETIEISANYFGEFSFKTFLNFINNFHQDILNFHKMNSMFIDNWVTEMDKEAKNSSLRVEVAEMIRSIKKENKENKESKIIKNKNLIKPDIVKKSKASKSK